MPIVKTAQITHDVFFDHYIKHGHLKNGLDELAELIMDMPFPSPSRKSEIDRQRFVLIHNLSTAMDTGVSFELAYPEDDSDGTAAGEAIEKVRPKYTKIFDTILDLRLTRALSNEEVEQIVRSYMPGGVNHSN